MRLWLDDLYERAEGTKVMIKHEVRRKFTHGPWAMSAYCSSRNAIFNKILSRHELGSFSNSTVTKRSVFHCFVNTQAELMIWTPYNTLRLLTYTVEMEKGL